MSKRYNKVIDPGQLSKKPRLDISINHKPFKDSTKPKGRIEDDDLWGEDFGEAELEELDLIASQACSQEANVSTVNINLPGPARISKPPSFGDSKPSTSTGNYTPSFNAPRANNGLSASRNIQGASVSKYQKFNSGLRLQASQKLASSENIRKLDDDVPTLDEFKKNLVDRANLNSTFQFSQKNGNIVTETDDEKLKKLAKLENDYNRLLNDFTSKEGETMYLRQQLQQTQIKAEKESMEKTRQIEQQACQFRAQINALHKENECMKTQVELKTMELNTIVERCKMLESKTIKLTTPQTVSFAESPKNRSAAPVSRAASTAKVKVSNCSIQTDADVGEIYHLRTSVVHHPFKRIPQKIFECSLPEKSIIDIEVVEKTGKRIVPILEDEESFKMFENADLVTPKVTMINNKILSVEFFQPDVAAMMKKTEMELKSKEIISIINKIVATTRELMLNIVCVFKAIIIAINNDDIRDMNDLYFSSFYDMQINHNQSLCDANEWHVKERGIEGRRALGILSYIAQDSNYLCEYVAGKLKLNIQGDEAYSQYSKQMIQYNTWSKKGDDYEMLEIILELVIALNYTRRVHQFTGLICAISRILGIVQKKVRFTKKGLNYIASILKEMVFSRPLFRCLIAITEMIVEFTQCPIVINRLIACPNRMAVVIWKNVLSFTDDACILEIYIDQLKRFHFDEITMINITHALMSFADVGFRSEVIPWPIESSNDDCCTNLLTFVVTILYRCAKIDLIAVRRRLIRREQTEKKDRQILHDNFWHRVRNRQFDSLRMGIRFLSHLAKRDPEVIIRSTAVDNSLTLFMEYFNSVEGLILHEVERQALALIQSFISDTPSSPEREFQEPKLFSTTAALQRKSVPSSTSENWYNFGRARNEDQQMIAMFESILQL